MRKLSKILGSGMAAILVFSLILSGCGKTDAGQASSASQSAAADQASATGDKTKLEQVTLTWYYPNGPQADQKLVEDSLNKDFLGKINANVKLNALDWGVYDQKMPVLLASGEEIDLCFTANWFNNYKQNVAKGFYNELDGLIDKYAPKLKASMSPATWDGARVDGKIYGVINQQIFPSTKGIMFNKALTEKYKFDIKSVKKLEDVEPFLKAVKEGEKSSTVVLATGLQLYDFWPIFQMNDNLSLQELPGQVTAGDSACKVFNSYNTPEFKSFLTLMRDWYKKGYIRKDAATVKDLTAEKKLGKWAISSVGTYKPGGDAEFSKDGVEGVSIPLGKSFTKSDAVTATMIAIPKTSKNPERAMMLMELINDPAEKAIYNKLVYGMEGQHYTKTGDNRIEVVKDSKYGAGSWEMGCVFNSYLLPGQPDTVWEDTKKMNESAIVSPLMGFSFDNTPVTAEISAMTSVEKEMFPALISGSYTDTEKALLQYNDKMEKAGMSKVLTEMQKQIDAWKAKK